MENSIQSILESPGPELDARPLRDSNGPYPMGMMVILATVTMLFAASTSLVE